MLSVKKIIIIIVVVIGLLVIGSGVGVYFYLQNNEALGGNVDLNNNDINDHYVNNGYENGEKANNDYQNNDNHELELPRTVATPEEVIYLATNFINQAGTMGEPITNESCELVFNSESNLRGESLIGLEQIIAPNSPALDVFYDSYTADKESAFLLETFQVSNLVINEDAILFYENTVERFYEITISLISTAYIAGPITEFVLIEDAKHFEGAEDGAHFFTQTDRSRFDLHRNYIYFNNIRITVVEKDGEFLLYDIAELVYAMSFRFSIWDGQWFWTFSDFQRVSEELGEVQCN